MVGERDAQRAFGFGSALITVASAPGVVRTNGSERFDGAFVVSNPSGKRTVAGSMVAMSGVFSGVGRIVERANRPGDSGKVSGDDLVFSAGTLHIVNVSGHMTLVVNPRTCTATFKVQEKTTVDGGSGRFAVKTYAKSLLTTSPSIARRT